MMQTFVVAFTIMQQIFATEVNLYDPDIAMELLYRPGAYTEIVGRGPAYGNYYLETNNLVQIDCRLPKNVTFAICERELAFEVYDEDSATVLITKTCPNNSSDLDADDNVEYQYQMQFRIPAADARLFGRLRCRFRQNDRIVWTNNSITLPFVICGINNQACQDNAPCDNDINDQKYCVVTKDGPKPCTTITDPSWCNMEQKHDLYCPVNELGSCNSAVKNASANFFTAYGEDGCPERSMDQSPLSYNGKTVLYKEPLHVGPPEGTFRFACPEGSPFFNTAIEISIFSNWNAKEAEVVCVDEVNFNLSLIEPNFFTKGASTHSMTIRVTARSSQKTLAEFSNNIISFGTELEISNQFGELQCMYTTVVGYNFRVTRWWTKESTGSKRLSEEKFGYDEKSLERNNPWTMFRHDTTLRKNDVYQCHVLLEYKNCAPHRLFQREISSKKLEYYYSSANTVQSGLISWAICFLLLCSLNAQ